MRWALLLCFGLGGTLAAVIHVSPGVNTLQSAVDLASSDDSLVLADGSYSASSGYALVEITRSLTIRAENIGQALLTGDNIRRVMSVSGSHVSLQGLHIAYGQTTNDGGGVWIRAGGYVRMSNCYL